MTKMESESLCKIEPGSIQDVTKPDPHLLLVIQQVNGHNELIIHILDRPSLDRFYETIKR